MDNGFGQMEVSGLAGQTGNPENRQQEEIMTISSSGGERTIEFGIMSKMRSIKSSSSIKRLSAA